MENGNIKTLMKTPLLGHGARTRVEKTCKRNLHFLSICSLTIAYICNVFWSYPPLHSLLFSYQVPILLLPFVIILTLWPTEFNQDHSHGHEYKTWVTHQRLHHWRQWLLFCQHPKVSLGALNGTGPHKFYSYCGPLALIQKEKSSMRTIHKIQQTGNAVI